MRRNAQSKDNDRISALASERQSLQKLKKTIDCSAVDKYQIMGEMKRKKAIKITEEKGSIKKIEQQAQDENSQREELIRML